jgi:hypothetical protein
MRNILLVSVAVTLFAGCEVSDATARQVLDGSGYREIELGHYAFFGCGEGEMSREFVATGPTGRRVSGVVCCGSLFWGKGCTVRF